MRRIFKRVIVNLLELWNLMSLVIGTVESTYLVLERINVRVDERCCLELKTDD